MKLTMKQISKINTKIKVTENELIVLIDVSEDKTMPIEESSYNIYRINNDNEIIWQVEKDKERIFDDMFNYLRVNNKGEIIGYRFSGLEYKIDPETGGAECIGFHK